MDFQQAIALVIVAVSAAICIVFPVFTKRYKLPPGPGGLPFIGNLLNMPRTHEWVRYKEWAEQYGPVVYVKVLSQRLIIINSHRAAVELLEKRSMSTSDRPQDMIMANELIGWNNGVALTPAGERHRRYRRLLAQALGPGPVREFHPRIQSSAMMFLRGVLSSVSDMDGPKFIKAIHESIASSVVLITYGHEISFDGKDYKELMEDAHEKFGMAAKANAFAVDVFPILRYIPEWFPGAGFQRKARQWRDELFFLVRSSYQVVKDELAKGDIGPSYVGSLLGKKTSNTELGSSVRPEDEQAIMWTATSLYTGGSDTTAAALTTFLLAMCLHPEVQLQAQQEIDKVTEGNRLPTIDDIGLLPYVHSLAKEVLRWYPIAPLGLPHRVTGNEVLDGFDIPAGFTVVGNIWGMCHDPSIYSNPDTFDPSRFMPSSTKTPELDPTALVFGFGRRICPGIHIAQVSLFTYVACILSVFNVRFPKKPGGVVSMPEMISGVISSPEPFPFVIEPRSPQVSALVGDTI